MRLWVLAGLGALSACNSGPNVKAENASMAEVAEKVAKAQPSGGFVSPGRWETTMTVEQIDVPGMPAEMTEQMKGEISRAGAFATCLTEADVKKPNAEFFGGGDKSCRYERFAMGDGKIDAVLKCDRQGLQRTMTMSGTYDPNTYAVTVKSEGAGPGVASMTMTMAMASKRTGECTGNEINKGEAAR